MDFITHIKEAFTNLLSAKTRSTLAILGIVVGTGSVVALISSSQLATNHALSQFKNLGTNLIVASFNSEQQGVGQQAQTKKIKLSDLPSIANFSPTIVEIAPYTFNYQSLYMNGLHSSGLVLGATETLANIVKIDMAEGRFISVLDKSSLFAVIGYKLADKLKKKGVFNPIGKQISLGKWLFTIIGITKPWQPNFILYADIDNGVIVPIESTFLFSSSASINNLIFRLNSDKVVTSTEALLTKKFKIYAPKTRVNYRTPQQIIDIISKQRRSFSWLLIAIGAISLLVGGIGVMNIMLVSVIERRREIGIRMAIGAKRSDIRWMFLIESVILTLFGGLIGVIFGVGVSAILAIVSKWGYQFYLLPPALGFIVSAFVGVFSGYYPANSASKLDPIQTLQSD